MSSDAQPGPTTSIDEWADAIARQFPPFTDAEAAAVAAIAARIDARRFAATQRKTA